MAEDIRCASLTQKGERCRANKTASSDYCSRHKDSPIVRAAAAVVTRACRAITKAGTRCIKTTSDPSGYCHLHVESRTDGDPTVKPVASLCKGFTKAGTPCTKTTSHEDSYCHLHFPRAEATPTEPAPKPVSHTCKGVTKGGGECTKSTTDGSGYCHLHNGETDTLNKSKPPEKERFGCASMTKSGFLCTNLAIDGQRWCRLHNEETNRENRTQSDRGGYTGKQCTSLTNQKRCVRDAVQGQNYCSQCLITKRKCRGHMDIGCGKVLEKEDVLGICFDCRELAHFLTMTSAEQNVVLDSMKDLDKVLKYSAVLLAFTKCEAERVRAEKRRAQQEAAERHKREEALNPPTFIFDDKRLTQRFAKLSVEKKRVMVDALTCYRMGSDVDLKKMLSYYRNRAKKHHPDQGGDPEMFKSLNSLKDVMEPFLTF